MKKIFSPVRLLLCAAAIAICCSELSALTLRIACRAKGIELILMKELVREWTKTSGVDVEIITLPHASNECFAIYKQLLSSGQCDLDVIAMDSGWISAFVDKLEDLYGYDGVSNISVDDYFDAIKKAIVHNGKLIALPLYTDVGILFYRKDLLEKYKRCVPKSYDELYSTAFAIQRAEREAGNKHIYGYVFSGKAAEGLMCVANEVITAFGGDFYNENICTLDSQKAIDAVNFLVKCARDICPAGLPNHTEEDSRGIFQIGNAVFMRNWPYAAVVSDSENLRGKVGITSLPVGTLGGWNLGVPKLSTNKVYAVSLVKHLTSRAAQKMRAIRGHYAPASKSLYDDAEVLKHNKVFEYLKHSLENSSCRPSNGFKKQYQKASAIFVSFLNTALANHSKKRYSVEKSLKVIAKRLNRLLKKVENERAR